MKMRKQSPIPHLAPESVPFLAIGIGVLLAILIVPAWLAVFLSFVYIAFTVWFFRDPERISPAGDDLVISPCDGRVVEVEEVEAAPYIGEKMLKVGVFMSPFNVHVNRNPISGTVEAVHYKQGGFRKAELREASLVNEHNATILRRDDGKRVMFIQVAGLVARRIVCYLESLDRVGVGERMGMIRFGSRVDIYMPISVETKVQRGDLVKAGETIIGKLPWS